MLLVLLVCRCSCRAPIPGWFDIFCEVPEGCYDFTGPGASFCFNDGFMGIQDHQGKTTINI